MEVRYVDFSKAFDSVNYRLLLSKMQMFGIGGLLYDWAAGILHNGSFYVRVSKGNSDPLRITRGVL